MLYLFIGQDASSKETKLKQLKQECFSADVGQFNLDVLYAKELGLKELQEKLLSLPVRAQKRMVVIKGAQGLKEDVREFILSYAKEAQPKIILLLDIDRYDFKDTFIKSVTKYAKVLRFRESLTLDTFALSRAIDLKKADYSLKVLSQLLENGEKPERILGGLRYSWERKPEARRKLKALLNCDIDIKTGRLKAPFALERLVVRLCCMAKPSG